MNRRVLHGKVTMVYFLVLGLYALTNIFLQNDGWGIFLLIMAHTVLDSLWIYVDPHLTKERSVSKLMHHVSIASLTILLYLYEPWRLLISFGSLIELSGLTLFMMRYLELSKKWYHSLRIANVFTTIVFRWGLPMYGFLVWTGWWNFDFHGLAPIVILFFGASVLIVLHFGWTKKLYLNNWHVSRVRELQYQS